MFNFKYLVSKPKAMLAHFVEADMVTHIIISSIVRLILVVYGVYHDNHFDVPYTDIDYKVFTDAARHVVNGDSPYKRHTFRYSPLIAIMLTPNVYFHQAFGKIIFCEIDLIVAYFIRRLVYLNVIEWMSKYESFTSSKAPLEATKSRATKVANKGKKTKNVLTKYNVKVETAIYWAHRAMLCWLYNPMTMAISTRGNSDSMACLLVVLTLYGIQAKWSVFLVGLLHGLSIHFRIYPVIYSLLFYMYYSSFAYDFQPGDAVVKNEKDKKNNRNKLVKRGARVQLFQFTVLRYLWPNMVQLRLVLGTLTSLVALTGLFYYLYGYKYIYESLIYHFVRVDFKHNFSLYFYLQYLTAFVKMPVWYTGNFWQPVLINLPPIVLILHFSFRYGLNRFCLNFGVLAQTITFVIYNKVITSQYFVWVMGLLPLCIWQIKLSKFTVLVLTAIWFLVQAAWLVPAYLLEFRGEEMFFIIWLQGVALFCAHIGIFGRLIKNFILPMGKLKNFDSMSPVDAFFDYKPVPLTYSK